MCICFVYIYINRYTYTYMSANLENSRNNSNFNVMWPASYFYLKCFISKNLPTTPTTKRQLYSYLCCEGFPGNSDHEESACKAGDLGLIPGLEDPLEKGMATHSRILAWEIPWTEEPVCLQPLGSRKVRYNWTTTLNSLTPPLGVVASITFSL